MAILVHFKTTSERSAQIGTWYQHTNETFFPSWQVLEIVQGFLAIFVRFKELLTALYLHITEFFCNVNCIKNVDICHLLIQNAITTFFYYCLYQSLQFEFPMCILVPIILIYLIFRKLVYLLLLTFLQSLVLKLISAKLSIYIYTCQRLFCSKK